MTPSESEKILSEARERFERAETAEQDIREAALEDLQFLKGEQWPKAIQVQRAADKRPCLTVNRLPQFVRLICNEQRQQRPAIQVNPVDDVGDPELAEVYQGLIRHIEYDSAADAAYDQALESAVGGSFGYFRVVTEFSGPESFDLDIKIKRIRNPFSVYIDPDAKEPDRSDMRWAFIVEDMSQEEFETLYPGSDLAKGGTTGWDLAREQAPKWMDGKGVRVAEYFRRTVRKDTLCLLENGEQALRSLLETIPEEHRPAVLKSRDTEIPAVQWLKICGTEILEETEWPGAWIPILPVFGAELEVDGKLVLESAIRHAKDSQKMLNFWVSAETEAITLAPKAPYIGAEGQFEGHPEWKTANTKNHAYLQYKPTSLNGQPIPPPQRQFGEVAVGAITQARMQCADDLKATIGIYDSAMGAHSNETSGRAIRARQQQSNTANFHLVDNLTRAMRHLGRILVDLIPKIYDAPRVVRIIGEDGEQKTVRINQEFQAQDGTVKNFRLDRGKFDVTISTGPSYQTKRQEAVESIMGLVQAFPPLMEKAGHILVKNMDWPGAQEIADLLKPPGTDDAQQIPPQVQAQMEQMGQMVEALGQQLNEAKQQLEQSDHEAQVQIEKAQIAAQAEIQVAEIRAQAEIVKAQFSAGTPGAEQASAEFLQRLEGLEAVVMGLHNTLFAPSEVPPEAPEIATGGDETPGYDPNGLPSASDSGPEVELM